MTVTKHFAILPDGGEATRSSKSRVYSHCVAVQEPLERIHARAKDDVARQKRNVAWCKEHAATSSPDDLARVEGYLANAEARLASNEPDTWGVVGWQSRHDLAEKTAAQYTKLGYKVRILDVDTRGAR